MVVLRVRGEGASEFLCRRIRDNLHSSAADMDVRMRGGEVNEVFRSGLRLQAGPSAVRLLRKT